MTQRSLSSKQPLDAFRLEKDRSTPPYSDLVLAELFLRTTLLWSQDVAEFSEECSANGKVET
jgi:hypothetical protein